MPCVPFLPIEDARSHTDFAKLFSAKITISNISHTSQWRRNHCFLGLGSLRPPHGPGFHHGRTWFEAQHMFTVQGCFSRLAVAISVHGGVWLQHTIPATLPFVIEHNARQFMVLKNRDRCTLKKVNTRLTEDVGGNICMLGRGEAAWKCRGLPTPTIFLQISAKSLFRIVLQWSRPQRADTGGVLSWLHPWC